MQATLSLWSKVLSPEQVSEFLRFEPDQTVIAGSQREPPRPLPNANGWHVICEDTSIVMLDKILEILLDRISIISHSLEKMLEIDKNIEIRIIVICSKSLDKQAFFIPRKLIKIMASINASFDIEFSEADHI